MGFGEALSLATSRLFEFKGRSRRSEFWYLYLALFLFNLCLAIIGGIIGVEALSNIGQIINLLLIPCAIRRLHDTNRSGWWYLLVFTIIGIIPLIIFWCQDSDPDTNEYGENPKMTPPAGKDGFV